MEERLLVSTLKSLFELSQEKSYLRVSLGLNLISIYLSNYFISDGRSRGAATGWTEHVNEGWRITSADMHVGE